jgi:hypothetical protein
MSPILGIWASAQQSALIANSYESIATVTASGSPNSITFSSIPSTYTHLQLRGIHATNAGTSDVGYISMLVNGDTATNYTRHQLWGTAGTINSYGGASTTLFTFGTSLYYSGSNTTPATAIIDILDYANTNKYKTLRSLSGVDNNSTTLNILGLFSTVWRSTNAITSITIKVDAGTTLQNGTTYALYGIKG